MRKLVFILGLCAAPLCVHAQNLDAFHEGTAIPSFGKIAAVKTDFNIPDNARFQVVFDTGQQATPGEINRTFNSAARFINMHVAAGVAPENIRVAIVVHGSAALDVTSHAFYRVKHDDSDNANVEAIAALLDNNTDIILCGQTAAYRGVSKKDLVPGVKIALSAMTAHALLLQQGFTANPF